MKTYGTWFRRGMRRWLIGSVAGLALILVVVGSALAWEQSFTSAPYNGLFTLTNRTSDLVSTASYVRWNSSGVTALNSDGFPRFDSTADCVGDPPQGDRFSSNYLYTNVPNYSWSAMDDCGNFMYNEEVELYINAGSVAAEQDYYYQVIWTKATGSASGEINTTYQRNNSPSWDWLDKVYYSY